MTLVGHRLGVTKLATLLNGNLVSSSDDHTLRVWDVESGECLTVARHTHFVRTLAVMHDGTLITGSHDGDSVRVGWHKFRRDILPTFPNLCFGRFTNR
jgi:WD40 repeat protein